MKNILVAGAGKSAGFVIEYLLEKAQENNWTVTVADGSAEAINVKINGNPAGIPAVLDINNEARRRELVAAADIVVSLMPPLPCTFCWRRIAWRCAKT